LTIVVSSLIARTAAQTVARTHRWWTDRGMRAVASDVDMDTDNITVDGRM